jgi:CBS-domain-containing membrane protein
MERCYGQFRKSAASRGNPFLVESCRSINANHRSFNRRHDFLWDYFREIERIYRPGGWSAKFSEDAKKSIRDANAVFDYKPLDVNFLPKGSPEETMHRLVEAHDDARPLVLTLALGQTYDSRSFASLLTAFATVPNFRGVAVLGEGDRLVAYSSVRQISWLASDDCGSLRESLLKYVHDKQEDDIIHHISMSVVTASNGSSYAEVLRKVLDANLSCIAIIDKHHRLCGIVDRDRLSAALVLSLTSSVQRSIDVDGTPAAM